MQKLIYFLSFSLLIVLYKNNFMNSNGDPFDYISSDIPIILDASTFVNKILEGNKIIVVISYLNNYYGDNHNDFYSMALLYTDLKKQFSNNKNIEFYRVHMCQGISQSLLDIASPSMQIYYQGIKIDSLYGKQTKSALLKIIISALRNNLKTIINENDLIKIELLD
jgi:hypothetical protein